MATTTTSKYDPLTLSKPRWVNWELRNGRKLPINPRTGQLARSNDETTWGTYAQARRRSDQIGVILGSVTNHFRLVFDGTTVETKGYSLCGIDLDGCYNGKSLTPEAQAVVDRIQRYTEISPSGRGVHILFYINNDAVEHIRSEFGIQHRKSFSVGPHHEMSLDLSNRFYTYTGKKFNGFNMIDSLATGSLDWFLRTAGPEFQARFTKTGGRVGGAVDNSRSGHAFRFLASCYGRGMSEEESCNELRKRKGPEGDWARSKGRDAREMQRAWGNAVAWVEQKRSEDGGGTDYLDTVTLSEITMRPVKWIWPGYFARGKLCLLVGESDCGKTQIAADIAARITKGLQWPDKSGRAPKGDILVLNAEDDWDDTLGPRFIAAGADANRIHFLRMKEGTFNLAENMKQLEAKLTPSILMVILDPITAFLGTKIDSFRQTHMRSILSPLAKLAAAKGVIVLMISHFNKNSKESNPLYRITDSSALGAACRCIMGVARDPDGEGRLIFQRLRNSLAAYEKAQGLGYSLEEVKMSSDFGAIKQPRVAWDREPVTVSIEELLSKPKQKSGQTLDIALDFLRQTFAKSKRVGTFEIIEQAEARNISRRTLYRARTELNLKHINDKGKSYWEMPT